MKIIHKYLIGYVLRFWDELVTVSLRLTHLVSMRFSATNSYDIPAYFEFDGEDDVKTLVKALGIVVLTT